MERDIQIKNQQTNEGLANAFQLYLTQNGYKVGAENCERIEHALMAGAMAYGYMAAKHELTDPQMVLLGKHLMMQRSFIQSFATQE